MSENFYIFSSELYVLEIKIGKFIPHQCDGQIDSLCYNRKKMIRIIAKLILTTAEQYLYKKPFIDVCENLESTIKYSILSSKCQRCFYFHWRQSFIDNWRRAVHYITIYPNHHSHLKVCLRTKENQPTTLLMLTQHNLLKILVRKYSSKYQEEEDNYWKRVSALSKLKLPQTLFKLLMSNLKQTRSYPV